MYGGLGKAVSSPSSIYDKATRLPSEVLRRHNRCAARCICPQQSPPVSALTHCKRNQVIHEAAAEDPIAHCARASEAESCQHFDHRVRFDALEEGRASVVQKIEDTNAGKGLGYNVCEDGASGVGVHRLDLGRDVVELGQGVDGDEDIGDVETTIVPEEHPHLTVSVSN